MTSMNVLQIHNATPNMTSIDAFIKSVGSLLAFDRRDAARLAAFSCTFERQARAAADQRGFGRSLEKGVALACAFPCGGTGHVFAGCQCRVLDARDKRFILRIALAQSSEAAKIGTGDE